MQDTNYIKWSQDDTNQTRKFIKLAANNNGIDYSISVKNPVEALPLTNIIKSIGSTEVSLSANETKEFLAIRNTSTEDINLRLATVNLTPEDNKSIYFKIELKDSADVTGTFVSYPDSAISEYSTDPIYTTDDIPVYPVVDTNNFGVSTDTTERINLFTGDIIARIEPNKTLCFSALSKNATSFNFFIRHVEEY